MVLEWPSVTRLKSNLQVLTRTWRESLSCFRSVPSNLHFSMRSTEETHFEYERISSIRVYSLWHFETTCDYASPASAIRISSSYRRSAASRILRLHHSSFWFRYIPDIFTFHSNDFFLATQRWFGNLYLFAEWAISTLRNFIVDLSLSPTSILLFALEIATLNFL